MGTQYPGMASMSYEECLLEIIGDGNYYVGNWMCVMEYANII